jgi:hypothetical protein
MNEWGLYKPGLTALVLPPVPFLILILVGARIILPRRGLGYTVLLLGVAGIWLSSCLGSAIWLSKFVLKPGTSLLGAQQVRLEEAGRTYTRELAQARRQGRPLDQVRPPVAIIVLGAGREPYAPE